MSIAALVETLLNAGVDHATVIAAVRAVEGEKPRAMTNAERQAKHRAARNESNGVTLRNETPSPEVSEVSPIPPSNLPNPFPKKTPKGVKKGVSDCCAELLEMGASAQHIEDWKRVRKAKNAGPISQSVVDILRREADAANVSYAYAVQLCAERCWQNFNREYKFPRPVSHADPPTSVFVPEDSPAFLAWVEYRRGIGAPKPFITESRDHGFKRGHYFPTEYPPKQPEMAH